MDFNALSTLQKINVTYIPDAIKEVMRSLLTADERRGIVEVCKVRCTEE